MIDCPEPLCRWGLPCPTRMLFYSLYQCLILNALSSIPIGANCLFVHFHSPFEPNLVFILAPHLSQIFMHPFLLTVWVKSLCVHSCSPFEPNLYVSILTDCLSQIFVSLYLLFEPNLYEPILTVWVKSLWVCSYHLNQIFMSLFLPFEQNLYKSILTIWAKSLWGCSYHLSQIFMCPFVLTTLASFVQSLGLWTCSGPSTSATTTSTWSGSHQRKTEATSLVTTLVTRVVRFGCCGDGGGYCCSSFFMFFHHLLLLFFLLSSSFWPRCYYHGCLANAPRTTLESSAGDVLQVPLWSCLHPLRLPAKTIRQQIELQKRKKKLQLRHPILQDTVQTDVVLPQDHTRLERTAPGGCDSWVTGLF